jgi:hypothetical protein
MAMTIMKMIMEIMIMIMEIMVMTIEIMILTSIYFYRRNSTVKNNPHITKWLAGGGENTAEGDDPNEPL